MKSSGSRGWEADLDPGAAERRVVDADRTAIELSQLAHDGQTDALAADALVEPGAAIEHALTLVDGNSRTIVLDYQTQPVASCRRVGDAPRRQPHLAPAPLEGVVQQVAGDFGQILPVASEETSGRDDQLAVDIALHIHL